MVRKKILSPMPEVWEGLCGQDELKDDEMQDEEDIPAPDLRIRD